MQSTVLGDGFPNMIRAVDCSHIRIVYPDGDDTGALIKQGNLFHKYAR